MLVAKVRKTIERYGMFEPGERVGVGLSGGADSTALLSVLHRIAPEMDISLFLIHVNHGLRGGESDHDAAFVEELSRSFGLPLEVETIAPGVLESGRRASIEDRARDLRYRVFESVRRSAGLTKIALGHTMDDQAETVLMKFLRGSGLTGLRGMLPLRDGVFARPLIETTREEVLDYLKSEGLSYVTDSTNVDERYLRNKVRRTVLPFLEETCNPNLREVLVRTADILREEEDLILGLVTDEARKLAVDPSADLVEIDLKAFRVCHRAIQRRLTRECLESRSSWMRERGFEHVESVLSLVNGNNPSAVVDLGGGIWAWREYDRLFIGKSTRKSRDTRETEEPGFCYTVRFPGRTPIKAISKVLSLEMIDAGLVQPPGDLSTVYLNASALKGVLTVRSMLPGDRIQPIGMKGHKKVKDLFIDAKVPRRLRRSIPLLVDERSVIWVWGYCLSERVKIRKGDMTVVKAEII